MKRIRSFILFSTVLTLLSISLPVAAKPLVVAITPFSIKADSSLQFLDHALIDLFASRLSMKDKVETVEKSVIMEAYSFPSADPLTRIINAGKKTRAQYILTGSLESSPKGVTLNAYVVEINTGKPVLEMTEKSGPVENTNSIITLVDVISAKINKTLFSRETTVSGETHKPEKGFDVHSHPDKLINSLEMKKK